MLQSFRQMGHSWLFKLLMMVLVLSFGVWGVGDVFRGNPMKRIVATAGDASFSIEDVSREFDRTVTDLREMFGPDITRQQAQQMGVLDKALDIMLDRAVMNQNAERLGVRVAEKTFIERIAADKQFRNPDGTLNKEMLRRALEQERISENSFAAEGGRDMARTIILDGVMAKVPAPKMMAEALYKARGQKRIFDMVTLTNDSLPETATPDDATLRAYYQENSARFTAPEYRALTLARLSSDDLAKDIAITDDDLKKAYDEKAADYARPESRDIVHVVMPDEAKAKQLAEAAKASGDLMAAAKTMGVRATRENRTTEKDLLPEVAKPAFATAVGQVADPVKSPLGWHVVQVTRIYPAAKADFATVKEQLRQSLQKDRAADETANRVNKLDDALAAGRPLEDVAGEMKLRVTKITAVDSTGKTPEGKAVPDVAPDVLKDAFAQASGETSPIQDDHKGNYTVVRTDSVTPATPRPFEKIRAALLTAWEANDQAKRATAEADKIADAMRKGKKAASFMGQSGVTVTVSKPISLLGDKDAALPDSALPRLMRLKKGEVAVLAQPNRQIVVRLAKIEDVDAAADTEAKGGILSGINTQFPHELGEEYVRSLRGIFPVTVDHDAINALTVQGE